MASNKFINYFGPFLYMWLFVSLIGVNSQKHAENSDGWAFENEAVFTKRETPQNSKPWLLEVKRTLFEPEYIQNFFEDLDKSNRLVTRDFNMDSYPKDCEKDMQIAREMHDKALNVTCYTLPQKAAKFRMQKEGAVPPMCKTPFLYNPGGGVNYNKYYACKPVEKDDEFAIKGVSKSSLHDCEGLAPGDNRCHSWCPTELDENGVFDPDKHGFQLCKPEWCDGLDQVCLSTNMRFCHFPFQYPQMTAGAEQLPTLHYGCTNQDSLSPDLFWCATTVSFTIDQFTCAPKEVYFSEQCLSSSGCVMMEYEEEEEDGSSGGLSVDDIVF